MTKKDRINNDYFEWLYDTMCKDRYGKDISYRKLFMTLHKIQFRWLIPKDENRASDGLRLRSRYTWVNDYDRRDADYIEGPCSVLEMMVALAICAEETIMDDPRYGDRTGQWFWGMITSLGLGGQYDSNFDKKYVERTIDIFLNREYKSNGEGGLFTIRRCKDDLREVEIWYQLCWYLDDFNWT